MKSVTIQQIARSCGVSPATVSRVLNHNSYVSDELRAKVRDAIDRVGYQHRQNASRQVTVLLFSMDGNIVIDNYSALFLMTLSQELRDTPYKLNLIRSIDCMGISRERCCGIISIEQPTKLPPDYMSLDVPIIFLNGESKGANHFCVNSDEAQGISLAIDYFHSRNHRHIGCLGVGEKYKQTVRYQAFMDACRRLSVQSEYAEVPEKQDFYEEMGQLIARGITALLATGESVGGKVAHLLQLYRYKIPQNLSLIGWETPPHSAYSNPPLTTISQDFPGLARTCHEILDNYLQNRAMPSHYKIPYFLIERDSVRNL